MTDAVKRALELLAKATKAPWRVSMSGYSVKSHDIDTLIVVTVHTGANARPIDIELRELCEDVERLERESASDAKRGQNQAVYHPAPGSRPDDLTVAEECALDLGEEIVKLKLDLSDPHTREVWETCQRAKAEVANWPAWKRGDEP